MPKKYGPHYQALREQVRKEQPYCATCERTEWLDCHHRHYDNFPENEQREDLVMLCKECHDAITDVHRRRRDVNSPPVKPGNPLPQAGRPEVLVTTQITVTGYDPLTVVKPMVKETIL